MLGDRDGWVSQAPDCPGSSRSTPDSVRTHRQSTQARFLELGSDELIDTRVFRLFVCSTFKDMTCERDALQERVYPRLRDLCQSRGASFQAIDLRWGVSEQASRDHRTMSICLGEIARCQRITPRPNFLILLGQRYGWQPLPEAIPDQEFSAILRVLRSDADRSLCRSWYELDAN